MTTTQRDQERAYITAVLETLAPTLEPDWLTRLNCGQTTEEETRRLTQGKEGFGVMTLYQRIHGPEGDNQRLHGAGCLCEACCQARLDLRALATLDDDGGQRS